MIGNEVYNEIRSGKCGIYEQKRGLIQVCGKEAVQFLDGLITKDMKTLGDGMSMLAAFPNAQGRLLAVVSVQRQGDRFLFETEEATREKVFQNLFRFTFAGDFFVADLSGQYSYLEIFGSMGEVLKASLSQRWSGALVYELPYGAGYFVPVGLTDEFKVFLTAENECVEADDLVYETLRVEAGIPKYGVDMDENTIVPELGIDGLISYNKGCYIGQEIIARIYFRGHVAKRLMGLTSETEILSGSELTTSSGKIAGRVTSTIYSPRIERNIALALVRYDHLDAGTELFANDNPVIVTDLPFVN